MLYHTIVQHSFFFFPPLSFQTFRILKRKNEILVQKQMAIITATKYESYLGSFK